jgi:hypothetical protein
MPKLKLKLKHEDSPRIFNGEIAGWEDNDEMVEIHLSWPDLRMEVIGPYPRDQVEYIQYF